jgi:hypothetical protein
LIEIDNQIRYIPYLLSIFNEKNTISNIHIHKRLEWFLNYLEVNFKITKEKFYPKKDDNTKLIITFRVDINNGEHLNIKTLS